MKTAIKNLVIGFGIGLVLITGLALASGGRAEAAPGEQASSPTAR